MPLMGLHGRVDDMRWTLAGRAVQLVEWDRTHRFCGRCGTPTEPARPSGLGAARLRTARLPPPRSGGDHPDRAGRRGAARPGPGVPVPMYSCIAGFVEPGETLEEAVHREVREEVGVELAEVRYVASQPWPFPHSLMIGFEATWGAGEIEIDGDEIVDANWYRPDDAADDPAAAVDRPHPHRPLVRPPVLIGSIPLPRRRTRERSDQRPEASRPRAAAVSRSSTATAARRRPSTVVSSDWRPPKPAVSVAATYG